MDRKLVCGLEVHQQLDTGKLFCRCQSVLRDEQPNFVFKRRIRPVPSELGIFDAAALEAFKKGYSYEYEAYTDSNCLIELDEEPVQAPDEQALDTVLGVAIMANANIVDNVHVMRKAVADGSVTSAFQRSALIALGGNIEVNGKSIRLLSIALEEDAARVMKRDEEEKVVTYRLDRLGIPLIEIATAPDIESPEEAQHVALAIGTLLRRTCKAKRGLGTIRQDVNISIPGGARVEIKGCQELGMIGEYVRREMQRQQSLLEVREELKQRKFSKESRPFKAINLTNAFHETGSKLFKDQHVFGIKLEHFGGLIGKELQPGRRLGTEFSNYVKARTGLRGIIHSDELPAYGLTAEEKHKIWDTLGCKEKTDAFVLVIGHEDRAIPALQVVEERAHHSLQGVPEETRNALEDGNSEYSRPLPGAARMYPETDLPTIPLDESRLKKARERLPKTPEERIALYTRQYGLGAQLAEKMKLDNWAIDFESWVSKGLDAKLAAVTLLETLTKLKREGFRMERLPKESIFQALMAVQQKKLAKEGLEEALGIWSENPQLRLENLIELRGETVSNQSLDQAVEKVLREHAPLVKEKGLNAVGPLMGVLMKEFRGKIDGKEISSALEKALKKRVKP